MNLVIVRNPEAGSSLPYLIKVPVAGGLVFRVKDTWPRTNAIFCFPVSAAEWPADPELVEQIPLASCVRRGAAIDVIAARGRENRSQIVFTKARGRDMVFWQAPRTRKQARPNVDLPHARAAGITDLEILVDAHERYGYRFADQQVRTVKRALACGDYAVAHQGTVIASVERKTLEDLASSLSSGRLNFAAGQLAALPRAAVVVEERYSQVFVQKWLRPATMADGLAELQVRYPNVPIVFCETRKLAQEWTYRFLAAALTWAQHEEAARVRIENADPHIEVDTPRLPDPAASAGRRASQKRIGNALVRPAPDHCSPVASSTADIRRWALHAGLPVSDRGRLRPEVIRAWRESHPG